MRRSRFANLLMATGVTLVAALGAAAMAWRLDDSHPARATLLPFVLAIAACGRIGGARLAAGATALSLVAASAILAVEEINSKGELLLAVPDRRDALHLVLLALIGTVIIAAAARMRRDAVEVRRLASAKSPHVMEAGLYRLAVEQAREHALFRVDSAGIIRSWNENVRRVLGWGADEWIGRPLAQVLPPVPVAGESTGRPEAAMAADFAAARKTGLHAADRLHATRDGRQFWAHVEVKVAGKGEQTAGLEEFLVVVRDLTGQPFELRTRGQDVAANRFHLAADVLPVMIAYVDRDERYRFHNAGYDALFGPNASFVGRTLRDVLGERSYARIRPYLDSALAGEVTRYEQQFDLPGVGARQIAAIYTPDRDAHGHIVGLSIFSEDITRQRELESRSRDILESIADGFYSLDRDWRFTYVNRRAMTHFGLDRDSVIGRSIWDVFPGLADTPSASALRNAMSGGAPTTLEVRSIVNGRWMEVRAYPAAEGISVYFHDVTERREAQELNARLASVVRSAADPMVGVDANGVIGSWNPAAERLFDFTADEAIGRHISLIVPEAQAVELNALIAAVRAGESVRDFETVRVRRSGEAVNVAISIAAVRGESGEVIGFSGTLRDLTERIERERNLRYLIDLSQMLASFDEPVVIVDAVVRSLRDHLAADRCAYSEIGDDDDTFTVLGDSTAPGLKSMTGAHRFDEFEATVMERMRANAADVVADVEAEAESARRTLQLDRFRAMSIRSHVTVPLHKSGQLVAMLSVHHREPRVWHREEVELIRILADRCWEALERARAAREVRASERKFRWLAETSPLLIWLGDATRGRNWFGRPWAEFTGRVESENLGIGWLDAVHPDDRDRCRAAIDDAQSRLEPFELEYRLRRADGAYRWMLDRGTPSGSGDAYVGGCLDITVRKEGEESQRTALDAERHARAESERVGRLKDEFLATLGHELRTPLNAILGWAQILGRGEPSPADVRRGLETIARNAKAQAQIIGDLLDMSRIVSGKIRLEIARVAVTDIAIAAADVVRPAAQAKQIELDLQGAIRRPDLLIDADPTRLQQILWNLLTNAVKFTPPGGRVEVTLDEAGDDAVEVTVRDNGAGIRPDFLMHLFERFRQADGSTTRKHGGLGLGLSIVKSLVESHGGRIEAHSDGEGRGATFRVTLPRSRAASGLVPPPSLAGQPLRTINADARVNPFTDGHNLPAASVVPCAIEARLNGRHVLIVDDEEDVLALVRRVLEERHATVSQATGVEQALELLSRRAPDLVISDIGMPVADGYELARRLRDLPAPVGRTPAIALTAFARVEDRQRSIEAGFNRHMAKPFDPDELVAVCGELLSEPAAR